MRSEREEKLILEAVDQSTNRFFIISDNFEILAGNSHTSGLFKKTIIGRRCYEVFHAQNSYCDQCVALEALETGNHIIRHKKSYPENGHRSCKYAYPLIKDGKACGIAIHDFDRPASEEVEEQLRRSTAFLKNLILSSVDGVIAADMKGKMLVFNYAASQISGYSVDEALNQKNILNIYPTGIAKDIMKKLRDNKHGGTGKLKSYMVNVLNKSGEEIPINLNAAIVYDGHKEVASIGFFHDMRDELKIKSKLEKTQLQLLQAEKMSSLGKLSAGVAHQLNNPLGGITLFAKLIQEEYDLEKGALEDINRILHDAQRCRDIVKELLEFARQTSHVIKLHDINKAISRTLFLLENQALFQNIKIERKFENNLPSVPIDIQQMNHVFMNLILNAGQAMENKGRLSVITSLSPDKSHVLLKIKDTGPGIPKKTLPHIFEPFFTTKEEGKGTGLGLSMVYGIIQNHKGDITVKSDSENGTVFTIKLPLNPETQQGENSEK